MRAVHIVSSQPDVLALVPELEDAGLAAITVDPGHLDAIDDPASALLLDLRDLSRAASSGWPLPPSSTNS